MNYRHMVCLPKCLMPRLGLTLLGQRPRVRRPPKTEYDERFIAPSFKGARTSFRF